MIEFDYTLDFDTIDYRKNPELYIIGRGEQGVLLCEPYKSEICKHWRFRTPQIAFDSANRIYAMFDDYLVRDEFVGADMARKFLMMGWTREQDDTQIIVTARSTMTMEESNHKRRITSLVTKQNQHASSSVCMTQHEPTKHIETWFVNGEERRKTDGVKRIRHYS